MLLYTGKNRILVKGINQVIVTISELNLINNAIYHFNITDEITYVTKVITVIDSSMHAIRYNDVAITLVDDVVNEDLASGIVYLNTGKHKYTITATNPISPFNSMICETGIVKVERDTPSPIVTYTAETREYKTYMGNISSPL